MILSPYISRRKIASIRGDSLWYNSQFNIKLFVSGMSAKARGYDESLLNGFNAEFAMPDKLLELSTESDTVLCY